VPDYAGGGIASSPSAGDEARGGSAPTINELSLIAHV